ncbi:MAG: hypothetical protein DWQ47_04010 [Acidobacteria bacterium]|nr:MAG: hypothetical protein DWQ32_07560 [Acidobacteriota bacterium]REK01560.1 MAG: hypothetical protein DWQ38_03995 [Acidobacteriota bacterium]REK14516.1 MAG: hypothetical protein DWQ43_13250 [Acidobacteriota bacterium]REK45231.1 MAG: hypothetical protein DWQ47_04010 [Acidobacteriota bacterium]
MTKTRAKNATKLLLLFICLNVLLGAVFYTIGYYTKDVSRWEKLAADSIRVEAKITDITDNKGGTVSFDYEVNGKRYSGTTTSYAASLLVGGSKAGDTIYIYVARGQPEIGEYENPKAKLRVEQEMLWAYVGISVFIFVWAPFIIGIIIFKTMGVHQTSRP